MYDSEFTQEVISWSLKLFAKMQWITLCIHHFPQFCSNSVKKMWGWRYCKLVQGAQTPGIPGMFPSSFACPSGKLSLSLSLSRPAPPGKFAPTCFGFLGSGSQTVAMEVRPWGFVKTHIVGLFLVPISHLGGFRRALTNYCFGEGCIWRSTGSVTFLSIAWHIAYWQFMPNVPGWFRSSEIFT